MERRNILDIFFRRCLDCHLNFKGKLDVTVLKKEEYMELARRERKNGGVLKDVEFVVLIKK